MLQRTIIPNLDERGRAKRDGFAGVELLCEGLGN